MQAFYCFFALGERPDVRVAAFAIGDCLAVVPLLVGFWTSFNTSFGLGSGFPVGDFFDTGTVLVALVSVTRLRDLAGEAFSV